MEWTGNQKCECWGAFPAHTEQRCESPGLVHLFTRSEKSVDLASVGGMTWPWLPFSLRNLIACQHNRHHAIHPRGKWSVYGVSAIECHWVVIKGSFPGSENNLKLRLHCLSRSVRTCSHEVPLAVVTMFLLQWQDSRNYFLRKFLHRILWPAWGPSFPSWLWEAHCWSSKGLTSRVPLGLGDRTPWSSDTLLWWPQWWWALPPFSLPMYPNSLNVGIASLQASGEFHPGLLPHLVWRPTKCQ